MGVGQLNDARTRRSRPTAPSATSSAALTICGLYRYMKASLSTSLARWARSKASSTSAGCREYGFSHSTCFPAARARIVQVWCRPFGSGMYTASTSGSASSSS